MDAAVRFSVNDKSYSTDFVTARRPAKPAAQRPPGPAYCPSCQRRLMDGESGIRSMFFGGARQLLYALGVLGLAVIRCLRFLLAASLYLVGLVGACCAEIARRIAHPHDRRLFARR